MVGTTYCFADSCTVGSSVGVRWSFPSGYEQCPALIAEQDREDAAERQMRLDAEKTKLHRIYQDGVKALEKLGGG